MNSTQEFDFIAGQLEWLEQRLRAAPDADSRMTAALDALACARAVISKLAEISHGGEAAPAAKAA